MKDYEAHPRGERQWQCKHCGNRMPDKFKGLVIERVDATQGFTRIHGRRRCNKCKKINGR